MKKKSYKKIFKRLGYVVLGLVVLIMAWKFDFDGFLASLGQISPPAFLALLGLQLVSQLLINYQWTRLGGIMGQESGFWSMLYVNSAGNLIDGVTPGVKVGGEVARALALKEEMNYSTNESATLVTIQKIISFASFFLVNLLAFAHLAGRLEIFSGIWLQILVYIFLFGLLLLLLSLFVFTQGLGDWLEGRETVKKSSKNWKKSFRSYLLLVLTNIQILKEKRGEVIKQFSLSLAIWLLFPIKMIILVALFTSAYDPVFLTEVTFTSYLMGMIPLLPGGLGSFEATMTSLLVLMNLEPGQALAISIIFRFITFWLVILLSLAYVSIWKVFVKK